MTGSAVQVSSPTQINATGASRSDLAVSDDGTIVAAYATNSGAIAARILDSEGQPTGTEITVSPHIDGHYLSEPDVVGLSDGRFLVSWSDSGGDYPDYRIHLRGEILNADGSVSLPDFALSDQTTEGGSEYRHNVTALADGGFELAYQAVQGPQEGFFAVAYGPDAAAGAVSAVTTTPFPGNPNRIPDLVELATLTNGAVAVASESSYNNQDIYTQIISSAGTTGPVQVSSGGENSIDQGARIVALDTGGYAIAWTHLFGGLYDGDGNQTTPGDKYKSIEGVVVENDGYTVDAHFSLTTDVPASQGFSISLTALTDGKFAVSYNHLSIVGQEFNADGSPLGSSFTIGPYLGDPDYYPASIGLDGDRFLETWSHYNDGALFDALVAPAPTVWNVFDSPAETTLTGTYPTFAAALAGAAAGNEIVLDDPAGTPIDLGDQSIGVENLTVRASELLSGEFILASGIKAFSLAGATDAAIAGNGLANVLTGSDGDNLIVASTGNDTLDGGLGADTADYGAATRNLRIDLSAAMAQAIAGYGSQTLVSIENVVGGSGNDVLTGSGAANVVRGQGGNDILSGLGGADTLYGEAGNDRLDGGEGADAMYGGSGNDAYTVDDPGDVAREDTVAGQDDGGIDTVSASVTFTLGAFLENLTLTGSASVDGTGNDLGNRITGNEGANVLSGGGGVDVLDGGFGDDTLSGGEGNDVMLGGRGADRYDGGAGIDRVDYSRLVGPAIVYLDGTDDLGNPHANTNAAAGDSFVDVENLTGSATANDVLTGSAGVNRLTGGGGDDRLYGKGGADILDGGDGNDQLWGGTGTDILIGGAGSDVFAFNTAPAAGEYDRIDDFVSGTDHIQVDASVFGGGLVAGHTVTLVASDTPSAAGQGTGGVFLYDTGGALTGSVYYDADGQGAGAAILFAKLTGTPTLTAGDFTIVA